MTCWCCKGISETEGPTALVGAIPGKRSFCVSVLLGVLTCLCNVIYSFKAQGKVDLILCNGSISCCSRLCVPGNVLVIVWYCIDFIETSNVPAVSLLNVFFF